MPNANPPPPCPSPNSTYLPLVPGRDRPSWYEYSFCFILIFILLVVIVGSLFGLCELCDVCSERHCSRPRYASRLREE